MNGFLKQGKGIRRSQRLHRLGGWGTPARRKTRRRKTNASEASRASSTASQAVRRRWRLHLSRETERDAFPGRNCGQTLLRHRGGTQTLRQRSTRQRREAVAHDVYRGVCDVKRM